MDATHEQIVRGRRELTESDATELKSQKSSKCTFNGPTYLMTSAELGSKNQKGRLSRTTRLTRTRPNTHGEVRGVSGVIQYEYTVLSK